MIAVTSEGEVFAWGDNRCGQFGLRVGAFIGEIHLEEEEGVEEETNEEEEEEEEEEDEEEEEEEEE